MANIYKNDKVSLTNTDLTTLYTVPSNSRAIVKSLLVSEDNGGAAVVKVTLVDAAAFSFSLQKDQSEVFLAMRRFLPNFKVLTGNNLITVAIKDFPSDSDAVTTLSPFTITSATTKVDTRARGRYANIKIENTGAGESWRFGTFQVDLQPDGRRG